MKDVIVQDNFLNEKDFNSIQNALTGWTDTGQRPFPWYWSHIIDDEGFVNHMDGNDSKFNHQFSHLLYYTGKDGVGAVVSEHFNLVHPIVCKLTSPKLINVVLIKIKANLQPCAETSREGGFHTDVHHPLHPYSTTAIYYVNTNNGYTKFEKDNLIVNSVANRLVTFPSSMKHCGSTCTDEDLRAVINFNYF